MCGFTLGGGTTLGGVTVDEINGVTSGAGVGATRTGTCSGQFRLGGGGGLGGSWMGFMEPSVSSLD